MTDAGHGPRIDWAEYGKVAPKTVAALRALGQAVDESGLDKNLTELIKLRASQLNGCAYCLQLHVNLARHLGVPAAKLDQLAAWRESRAYDPRERAALAWTEALTRMAAQPVRDTDFAAVRAQFSEAEVAFLTAAIANINAWNRIAGALAFTPPPVPRGT